MTLTRYFSTTKRSQTTVGTEQEQFIFISSNRMNNDYAGIEKYIAPNDFKYFEPWPDFKGSPIEKPNIKGQEPQEAKFLKLLIQNHIELDGTGYI